MLCGEEMISASQVRSQLGRDGFKPGTSAFREEMDRRFMKVDDGEYAENPSWDGTRLKPTDYD